jgi:hypothetical protein
VVRQGSKCCQNRTTKRFLGWSMSACCGIFIIPASLRNMSTEYGIVQVKIKWSKTCFVPWSLRVISSNFSHVNLAIIFSCNNCPTRTNSTKIITASLLVWSFPFSSNHCPLSWDFGGGDLSRKENMRNDFEHSQDIILNFRPSFLFYNP